MRNSGSFKALSTKPKTTGKRRRSGSFDSSEKQTVTPEFQKEVSAAIEDWKQRDAILPLKEYLETNDPEKIVDFVKTVFYIISEYQNQYPEKILGADDISAIFEQSLMRSLRSYQQEGMKTLRLIYPFLPAIIQYLSFEIEAYLSEQGGSGLLSEFDYKFQRKADTKLDKKFSVIGCEVHPGARDSIDRSIQELVCAYFKRVCDFVCLLQLEIEKSFKAQADRIAKEHAERFKAGFSAGIETSDLEKQFRITLTLKGAHPDAPVRRRETTPEAAPTPTTPEIAVVNATTAPQVKKTGLKARWKKLRASWKTLPLRWKILMGIAVVLEVSVIVACALLFPPSALVTVPGGAVFTTKAITAVAGKMVVERATTQVPQNLEAESDTEAPGTLEGTVTHEPFVPPAERDEVVVGLQAGEVTNGTLETSGRTPTPVPVSENQNSFLRNWGHPTKSEPPAPVSGTDDECTDNEYIF